MLYTAHPFVACPFFYYHITYMANYNAMHPIVLGGPGIKVYIDEVSLRRCLVLKVL
jgi:hypothetical protein